MKKIKIEEFKESLFKKILFINAVLLILLVSGIFLSLFIEAFPAIKKFGVKFLFSTEWDPVNIQFGALSFLVGTLITSFLALFIAIPFSLAISIFLGEYYKEGKLASLVRSIIELAAGIPSVIYGFWGLFCLVPLIRNIIPPHGLTILTASLVLAIMIIPYSASIGREVIFLVPVEIKEAAYSLGATKAEVIWKIILPYASSGIFAGFLLALGRALGETMAVCMVIGNVNQLTLNIFNPANTMASVIALEFTEATEQIYYASIVKIGLLLFIITTVVNMFGRFIIKKIKKVSSL